MQRSKPVVLLSAVFTATDSYLVRTKLGLARM